MTEIYRGRFAPTPSGPLHFGSLVAALGSYLEARCHGGVWRLRIDDLDRPRVQPGAIDGILRCLESFGFQWDGPVIFQSRRLDAYHAALHRLRQSGLVYPCACSRSEIQAAASEGIDGPIYSGRCREGLPAFKPARAYRARCSATPILLVDPIQGTQMLDLQHALGDFVLYRSDGIFSFHLASAVDDADMGMTDIVRGEDLLPSSLRQIFLLQQLGKVPPRYAHLPVAMDSNGQKLSKQTHAPPLNPDAAPSTLIQALTFLGQSPPASLAKASLATCWQWTLNHWRLAKVPAKVHGDAGSSFASASRSAGSS